MKRKCAFCDNVATKIYSPILGTIPKDPQGYMKYKLIGNGLFVCDKHELKYEGMKIENYFNGIK